MEDNPRRWRTVLPQLKFGKSVLGFLATLVFVPILVKALHVSIGIITLFIAIYVSLILPSKIGVISDNFIVRIIRSGLYLLLSSQQWNYLLTQLSYVASWFHYLYFGISGVQAFSTQVVFNVVAQKLFCPREPYSSYNIMVFYIFLAYAERSLQKKHWTLLEDDTSAGDLIDVNQFFILIRLVKGIVISGVFFHFGYQFTKMDLTYTFFCMTFSYFCLTHYQNGGLVKNTLIEWLTGLELQCLDGLEQYWGSVFIHSVTIGMSGALYIGLVAHTDSYISMLILGLINIVIPLKHLLEPAWKRLCDQKTIISSYALATWSNPQIRGKHPCAVCLEEMKILTARVTPCGHVFHGSCLRKCLQHSKHCPLCKKKIVPEDIGLVPLSSLQVV